MASWPPDLAALKVDMRMEADDDRFDEALQVTLDAAVKYVQKVRKGEVDFEHPDAPEGDLVGVDEDLVLGTLRYARRLDIRRDSPSGMVVTDQVGATPVAGWDADIEKLLRVGRYTPMRFA